MHVPTWMCLHEYGTLWYFIPIFQCFFLVYYFRYSQFILQTASSLNAVAEVKSSTYIKLDLFRKISIGNTCNVIINDYTIEFYNPMERLLKYYRRNRVA